MKTHPVWFAVAWLLLAVLVRGEGGSLISSTDGEIPPTVITFSSSRYGNPEYDVRLDTGYGWVHALNDINPYIHIDLLSQHNVTTLSTRGSNYNLFWYVKLFTIFYSNDNLTWRKYVTNDGQYLLGSGRAYTLTTHNFDPPLHTRYIVVQPEEGKGLRLDITGCKLNISSSFGSITKISGDIEDNQEWNITGSPYILNTMITVRSSALLKVHPGVKIVFNTTEAGISVQGTLEALGDKEHPIVFGYPRPFTYQAGQWTGIGVASEGFLSLEHCDVFGARVAIAGPLKSLSISNCHIHDNENGLTLTEGDASKDRIHIQHSQIGNNYGHGIITTPWSINSSNFVIVDSIIERNDKNGLKFSSVLSLTVNGSDFSGNLDDGIGNYEDDTEFKILMEIDNCQFNGNGQNGIKLDLQKSKSLETMMVSVRNSTMRENTEGGLYAMISKPPEDTKIALLDSEVKGNDIGVNITILHDKDGGVIQIRNNTFTGKDDAHAYTSLLNISNFAISPVSAEILVEDNIFMNSNSAIELYSNHSFNYLVSGNSFSDLSSGPYRDFTVLVLGPTGNVTFYENRFDNYSIYSLFSLQHPVVFRRNLFLNQLASYFVLLEYGHQISEDMDIRENYWGTIDIREIRSKVCDFLCNSKLGLARISPYYATEDMIRLIDEPDLIQFGHPNDDAVLVGGVLNESVIIGPHQHLYVNYSILVPENLTLNILQNVTLMFSNGQGIHVEGTLRILGQEGSNVVLGSMSTSVDEPAWNGITITNNGSWIEHAEFQLARTAIHLVADKSPLSINISHTSFNDCWTAVMARPQNNLDITLDRIIITGDRVGIDVYPDAPNLTTTVSILNSYITSGRSIKYDSIHPNTSVDFTIISSIMQSSSSAVNIASCKDGTRLTILNSNITSTFGSAVIVDSSELNILIQNVSFKASPSSIPVQIRICAVEDTQGASGNIDILDSTILTDGDYPALQISTFPYYRLPIGFELEYLGVYIVPHNVTVLNNSFQSKSKSQPSLYVDPSVNAISWSVFVQGNVFTGSGMGIYGSIENATLTGNKAKATILLTVNVVGNAENTMDINQNVFEEGQVSIFSENDEDTYVIEANNFTNPSSLGFEVSNIKLLRNNISKGKINFKSKKNSGEQMVLYNTFWGSQITVMNPNITIKENAFYKGAETHTLVFQGKCSQDFIVNCSYNFWDTTSINEIRGRIYDVEDDKTLPRLAFVPFYSHSIDDNGRYLLYGPDVFEGGLVDDLVTLQMKSSPYNITEDIVVDRLGTLVLEAGVTLLFSSDVGIVVEGTLRVLGDHDNTVKLLPSDSANRWRGVEVIEPMYLPEMFPPENVRLVGGCLDGQGQLEVNIRGEWGSICQDGFSQNDANVICRMLGYRPTESHDVITSGELFDNQSPERVFNKRLRCTGREISIDDCPVDYLTCWSGRRAAITCGGRLLSRRQDIRNEVEFRNAIMSMTEKGLVLNGNVTSLTNVTSTFSRGHGVTIYQGVVGLSSIDGIVASNNRFEGLTFKPNEFSYGDGDDISISNSEFNNNDGTGLDISYSVNITITECLFNENKKDGIYFVGSGIIDIEGSKFLNNSNSAFDMNELIRQNGSLKFSMKNSLVIGNVERDQAYYQNVFKFFPVYTEACLYEFVNNTFEGNFGNIIFLNTHRSDVANTMALTNNTLKSNQATLLYIESPARVMTVLNITNNTIINNNFYYSRNNPLVTFELKPTLSAHGETNHDIFISENVFKNNRFIEILKMNDYSQTFSMDLKIWDNVFKDNDSPRVISVNPTAVLRGNVFDNPIASCELEASSFYEFYETDARWNYWGGSTFESVFSRICSFEYNMGLGLVTYLPFHLSTRMTDTSNLPEGIFLRIGLAGGIVNTHMRVAKAESPLTIARSIYIRRNASLTLESGVELRFKSGRGIYVSGVLIAQGNDDIKLVKADQDAWYGLVFPNRTAVTSRLARLRGGAATNEGRVELFLNKTWTPVCNLDNDGAKFVCESLGYRGGKNESDSFGFEDDGNSTNLLCDTGYRSLRQCQTSPITLKDSCSPGIKCSHSTSLEGGYEFSYLENVSVLRSRFGVKISTKTVKLSNCTISHSEIVGLTLALDSADLDLNGTVVENGMATGIDILSYKYVRIQNGIIRNHPGSQNGLSIGGSFRYVIIQNMKFVGSRLDCSNMKIDPIREGLILIRNTYFLGSRTGFRMRMFFDGQHGKFSSNYRPAIDIRLEDNYFYYTSDSPIDIELKRDQNIHENAKTRVVLRRNLFKDVGTIEISSKINADIYVEDNTVKEGRGYCFMIVDLDGVGVEPVNVVSITNNIFEAISGDCGVGLKTYSTYNGTFNFNTLNDSSLYYGVIVIDSLSYSLSFNSFDNPDSRIDIKVLRMSTDAIKAKNNIWVRGTDVESRVDEPARGALDMVPTLTFQDFDCSSLDGCNGHGRCVQPSGCWCRVGWQSPDCSQFDCSGVYGCHANGQCIGPNLRECMPGWEGEMCDVFANPEMDYDYRSYSTTTESVTTISVTARNVTARNVTARDVTTGNVTTGNGTATSPEVTTVSDQDVSRAPPLKSVCILLVFVFLLCRSIRED